jgi:PTH1 family peptidyl-tRNA hydrolase
MLGGFLKVVQIERHRARLLDMFIIAGLGNPDEEYKGTRHNTGRMMLEAFRVQHNLPDWEVDKKSKSLISKGEAVGEKIVLVEPETYMNKSGSSLAYFVKSKKAAEKMIVIYDDLDLPVGSIRVSFNKSSGGHRGLQSIISALKTEGFLRVRVGISPVTAGGKLKKPKGEDGVSKHILGDFKKPEQDILKKVSKRVSEALEVLIKDGKEKAMGEFNR